MKQKNQSEVTINDKSKVIIINILFLTTFIIIFLGIFFSLFSLINHITFKILNSSISGLVFGVLVLYLGIRYYLSVDKFKDEFLKSSSKFSFSNFKFSSFNINFFKRI